MEVTFVTNGGTSVSKLEDVEKLPTPLPATTKTNNIFVGWFYDSEFEIQAFSDDTISSNITLYAKWYANMEDFFQDVADAIRSKTGETNPIKHTDFAYKIKTLQSEPEPIEPSANVVRFVSGNTRTITPKYTNSGITLQYSVDSGATWNSITSGSATTSATEHWFRGQATGTKALFTDYNISNAWAFSGSSDLEVYGNLNFLLCDTMGDEIAPKSVGDYCYSRMFFECTSLTTAPELPATTLATYCYNRMFQKCTSLIKAPELPATILKNYCYEYMFENCLSLTTAPELPATTLAMNCYSYMFANCILFQVSQTNAGSYTYAWRIPTSGTGTAKTEWNKGMLTATGGTFKGDPSINTVYYVVNEPL